MRIFIYDGRDFPDPNPSLSVDDVKAMMTDFFPELANAEVKQALRGDDQVFEFVRRVGVKG